MAGGPARGRLPGAGGVAVAVVLLTLNLRPAVTGLSPLLGRLSADLTLSTGQAGLLGALPPFCFAAAGLSVPTLLRRFCAERIVLAVLVIAAAGQLLRPWAPGAWPFLALSLVVLLGLGSGNVVLPVLVKAWFPQRIPSVTALYVTGVTAGAALAPGLAVPVADAVADRTGSTLAGWRVSLAWWGALALVCLLAWLRPARHPRAGPLPSGPAPDRHAARNRDGAQEQDAADEQVVGQDGRPALWRSRTAWGVALIFGTNALSTYAMFTWLPTRLMDAGMGAAPAGRALAVFAAMGIPGALVVPSLTARVHRQVWLVAQFAIFLGLGELGLLVSPLHATLVWAALAGWGVGAFPLALTLVGLRSGTPATAGALSGFAQGTGYLLAALGPLVVGGLRGATGGWAASFVFLWASVGFMVAGGWLAGRPGTVEADLRRGAPPTTGGDGPDPGRRSDPTLADPAVTGPSDTLGR